MQSLQVKALSAQKLHSPNASTDKHETRHTRLKEVL